MRLFCRLILLIFLLHSFSSCSVIFSNRRTAYKEIGKLKETVVLVKLKSADSKIKKLKESNNHEEARRVQKEVLVENTDIINAFMEDFTFCEFYFFEPTMTNAIQEKNFDRVQLIDGHENVVEDISFLKDGFYVATFEGIYETQFVSIDEDGRRRPTGGTGRLPGLGILDEDFIQLKMPFPKVGGTGLQFALTQAMQAEKSHKSKLVKTLDYELTRFYDRNYSKVQKYSRK